jgi:hypothetical protein
LNRWIVEDSWHFRFMVWWNLTQEMWSSSTVGGLPQKKSQPTVDTVFVGLYWVWLVEHYQGFAVEEASTRMRYNICRIVSNATFEHYQGFAVEEAPTRGRYNICTVILSHQT